MSEIHASEPHLHHTRVHPAAYAVLIVPFGAISGYVTVAMAFLCTRHQLSVQDGALLIASGMFPNVWKFLWAPVADTTLTRKKWYVLSVVLCAFGITAMSAIPMDKKNLLLLQATIFATNFFATFLAMSVEGIMAHATPPQNRGRVGGWFQAGNLGGTGLGGGAGLWVATNIPSAAEPQPWMSGAALGLAFLAGSLALFVVPEVKAEGRTGSLPMAIVGVAGDMWRTIKSRAGMLCALLCLLPMNSGTATNVLNQASVAAQWGADERTVALVNGVLNGILSVVGCLVAGEICSRISSRVVYAGVGVLLAGVAVAMALAPQTQANFVIFSLIYIFVVSMSYTAFTGFVLDTIGKGAAATKYNAFASLSNTPIMYMGLVLAWAHSLWGEHGMLYTDAAAGVLGLCVLGIGAFLLAPRSGAATAAAATPDGREGSGANSPPPLRRD